MAKKGPSKHSRAARRATSPGIDVDRSLKDVKAPAKTANERTSVLGLHAAAGVAKKTRKVGRKAVVSQRARKRLERGLDMAEAVMDRTARKVEKSKSQSFVIQKRSKEWTEINSVIAKEMDAPAKPAGMFAALADEGDASSDSDASSGASDDAAAEDKAVRDFYGDDDMAEAAPLPAAVPLAALATDDDAEIL